MAFANPNLLSADSASAFEAGSTAWTAGGNTTVSVSATEFLVGAKSMRITATAAGSAVATSPRFLVAAGKTYAVRLPLRKNTATAGQVFTSTITWYNATSGGTSLGTATFTLTLGTVAGWQATNYAVPSGVAPAGALSATVTISVSGAAAAEFFNTDDIYAAEVTRRTGDLLSFNVGGVENDASGWLGTNAAISRVAGFLAVGAGYYSLAAVSVAAGNMDIRTSSSVAVTAGQTYVAYAAVQSSVTLSNFFELRWYDASDVLLSTEQRTWTSNTGIARFAITGVAPAGAMGVRLAVRPQATGAGQSVFLDDMTLCPAPNVPGNLLTYEEYSSESTLPTWLSDDLTLSRAYLTSTITEGFYAIQAVPAIMGVHTMQLGRLIPVTPGATYVAQASYFRHSTDVAQAATFAYRTRIDWYNSAGNLLLADNPDQLYSSSLTGEFAGSYSTETRTAPAGAAFARVGVDIDHSSPLVDYYMVDSVSLKVSTPEYTLITNNDTGSVTYTINSAPSYGTSGTINVYRVHQDGSMVPLRGYGVEYDRTPFTQSPVVIEDYEAPLGESVWYKTDWFDTASVPSMRQYTQSVNTPVIADPNYVWFKSPGLPAVNTLVMIEAPLQWSRASRSATYSIVGRKNPVHVTSLRAGRTSNVTLLIWDASANALFNSLLDSGLPALIQAMPGYGVEGNLYLSIGDVSVEPLDPDARQPGWRWTLSVTEIDRPSGGLQGTAGATWQSINDRYATWADVFNADATWADVLVKG